MSAAQPPCGAGGSLSPERIAWFSHRVNQPPPAPADQEPRRTRSDPPAGPPDAAGTPEPAPPPDLHVWITLNRAHNGRLWFDAAPARRLLDQGRPPPGYVRETVPALLDAGLLTVGPPNEYGDRRVVLSNAGRARYEALLQRARQVPIRRGGDHAAN